MKTALFQLAALFALFGALGLAQAPPATPSPLPTSSAPPPAPAPPSSPPPAILTPHSPSSTTALLVLTRLISSEKREIAERDELLKKAQDLQQRITGLDQAAQDEIFEIKKAEGWGAEVRYDGEKERFERAGGARVEPPSIPAAPTPKEKK